MGGYVYTDTLYVSMQRSSILSGLSRCNLSGLCVCGTIPHVTFDKGFPQLCKYVYIYKYGILIQVHGFSGFWGRIVLPN